MKINFFIVISVLSFVFTWLGCEDPEVYLQAYDLHCENRQNPLGIDKLSPRLSWKLKSEYQAKTQSAYRILVSDSKEILEKDMGNLWDSDVVTSSESVYIKYSGKMLSSGTQCFWKVRVWDEQGNASPWSTTASWSIGLLQATDWKAQWIGLDDAWSDTSFKSKPWANGMSQATEYLPLPCPLLRKEFELQGDVQDAFMAVTALGIYEVYINGKRVGNDYFTPGWTDYRKRIYYHTYDVSDLLQPGTNTLSAILADGWYAGNVANRGQYHYGKYLRLKAQLSIDYKNSLSDTILTDASWKATYGPWREADMQGGETYDARLEHNGWMQHTFDDSQWKNCLASDTQTASLQSYPGIPVRKIDEIIPTEITKLNDKTYMVNMGQNFAGWLRLNVSGQKGDSIVMRFGEKLNEDGTLHTRNLRTARCTDTYVLKGSVNESWEPRFTYHGFQFVEITGFPGELNKDQITGVVLHSDLPQSGTFTCSNNLINQIQSNIAWSQRSNYFDIPTDCPQRDERMGWTGDAQVFMKTAAYNMDVSAFFDKWLVDVADGQYENGRFPSTAPRIYNRIAAGWGDAGIICPWNMFMCYNDTTTLKKFYPNMRHWMSFLSTKSPDHISTLGTYGDWQNVDSETPKEIIATAYYKRCSDLMSSISTILNKKEEASHYSELSQKIKKAFQAKFLNDSCKIQGNTQTAYLLALSFDLVSDSIRDKLVYRLLSQIDSNNHHLTTGILGTHLLLPTLTQADHLTLAYQMLMHEDFPSWGHHINNGATTIWERWDSYSKQEGFHEDSTNSLNHYAYGAIGQWFYSTIAGINTLGPGYKHILIHPQPGGGLTFVRAEYESIRGKISSNWTLANDTFTLDVIIPANTDAKVVLPVSSKSFITVNGQPLKHIEKELISGNRVVQVGSGNYHFVCHP